MSDGIWYPSRNHCFGMCNVDRQWFPPDHLEKILEQFPDQNQASPTIRIPEDIKFETPTAWHHYIFKGGVPYHGVICKSILKECRLILHLRKREVT